MLNRRHIRVKVMQSLYAMLQTKSDDLSREEKFLRFSIDKMHELYALQLQTLLEVQTLAKKHMEIARKKHLLTSEDANPKTSFIHNTVLEKLRESPSFLEYVKSKKLDNWSLDDEYIKLLWKDLQQADFYKEYLTKTAPTFEEDKDFVVAFYSEVIAPNEKLMDYYEDKNISWIDDIPFINTWIVRNLKNITAKKSYKLSKLYKDEDDYAFVSTLFNKTFLNHKEYEQEVVKNTPNWDVERIANVDMLLIKMAITEFLQFPSIPIKVTINEYIEISKDYSTKKSSFFINGVLDKISKDLMASKRIQKIGRGLL